MAKIDKNIKKITAYTSPSVIQTKGTAKLSSTM